MLAARVCEALSCLFHPDDEITFMLKFQVFDGDTPAEQWPLRNCYLLGGDGNPIRAEIFFEDSTIFCDKRDSGTVSLAIQHGMGELGELTLQTCLLPEREEPYLLNIELVRHRLMMIYAKLEDWSMFDLPPEHYVSMHIREARTQFIEALSIAPDDPAAADALAHKALVQAVDVSEELSLAHAEACINRRRTSGSPQKFSIGVGVPVGQDPQPLAPLLDQKVDHTAIWSPWRSVAPTEGEYDWSGFDAWVKWASDGRMPLTAGPVLCLDPRHVPDWLYIWEHDFDTMRNLIYEHIENIIGRYKTSVSAWNVVSGLHVNQHFTLNFDQIIDLTRMSTMLVTKHQPNARAIIEIIQPFGEYYAQHPRSIPPLMYADLVVQSGIRFDAFSIKVLMGQSQPGQHARDLMQIGALVDKFAVYGKPIHLTVAAPSEPVTPMMIEAPEGSTEPVDHQCGAWRRPWSATVQAHWLEALMQIAASRPSIELVSWCDLVDHPQMELPMSGVLNETLGPKTAYEHMVSFRRSIMSVGGTQPPATGDSQTHSGSQETGDPVGDDVSDEQVSNAGSDE